jgi:transposase
MSDQAVCPPRSRASVRLAWADRVARFAASGVTAAAFCAAEGVSLPAFYSWKRRLAAPPPAEPRLLPVRLAPAPAVELALPGGAVLRLAPGCDLAFVRSLVDALTGGLC